MNAERKVCVPPVPRGEGRAAAFAPSERTISDDLGRPSALDPTQFHVLREIAREATLSQRDLAGRLGMSLGRANFVVNSLIRQGLIKARRFKNSRNRLAYRYLLTPEGVREKVRVTRRFIQAKLREHERLAREIEELRREAVAEPAGAWEGGSEA